MQDETFMYFQCCTFSELLTNDIATMTKALKDFEINLDAMLTTLTKYYDKTEMDDKFYMCV